MLDAFPFFHLIAIKPMEPSIPTTNGRPSPIQPREQLSLKIAGVTQLDATGAKQVVATSLEVGGEELRLLHRKAFHWRTHVQGIIQFAAIANVRVVDNGVAFDNLRDGYIFRTITVVISGRSRNKLVEALPTTLTDKYEPGYGQVVKDIDDYAAALRESVGCTWVSYLVIAACTAYFIWMCLHGMNPVDPSVEDIFNGGGNLSAATFRYGQWWRLLSSGFVHCGILHLFLNMWFLFAIGRQAERFFGHLLYALIYLAALVGGSMLSGAINDRIVSAGASGALFGLVGAIVAYMLRNRGNIPPSIRSQSMKNMFSCIFINLVYGMRPGIDNWCHIGGLVAGFVCGLIAAFPLRETDRDAAVLSRALILAVLIPGIGIPAYRAIRQHTPPLPAVEEAE